MQVARLDYSLHSGADPQRTASVEEVALYSPAGYPNELADVCRAFAFLGPVEALQLAHRQDTDLGHAHPAAGGAQQ